MRALLAIALLLGTAEARPFMPRQPGRSVFVLAIARDSCTTYPVNASANSGTISSVATGSLCGTAAGTLVVCAVGLVNSNPTTWAPPTLAWTSANGNCTTFTKQIEATGAITASHAASIWTATCSASFSGVGVTMTPSAGSTNSAAAVTCDVLTNASGTVGNSNANSWDGVSTAGSTAISGVTAGSWLYVAAGVESVAAVTPTGSTSEVLDVTNGTGPTVAATGVDTSGASGSITVGWSTNSTWGAVAALEIKKGP